MNDMTENTFSKEQMEQAVLNAETRKDISTIKDSVAGIQTDLKMYAAQFVPNSMFLEYRKEVDRAKGDSDKLNESFDGRLRFLERYAWAAIGILGALEFLMPIALHFWK